MSLLFRSEARVEKIKVLIIMENGEQTWVKANYETAMLFVAYIEVGLVFGRILLGAITFQNS